MTRVEDEPAVLIAADASAATYAQRLCAELLFRGYLVRELVAHERSTEDVFEDAVRVVLVVASADAGDNAPIRHAIAWAQANDRLVLPLWLSGDPWPQLSDLNLIDVRDGGPPPEAFFRRIDASVQEAETSLSEGAWALLQLGLWQAAAQGFSQRIEIAPDDEAALLGRGFSALGLGRYEQALRSFDRVLARAPDNVVAQAGRGEALVGFGDFDQAQQVLAHVLEQLPEARRSALPLSRALDGLGRPEEALSALEQTVPAPSVDDPLVSSLASRLEKLNATSDAFHDAMPIEDFLSISPSHAEVEHYRAALLDQLGRASDARRARRSALRIGLGENAPPGAEPTADEVSAPGTPGAAVFISYSRDDQAYVRRLADKLTQSDLPVWFDEHIRTGDQWLLDLERRLRAAVAVVVVVSPSSLESTWVRRELLLADQLGIPILPLRLAGESIPLLLDLDHVDVSDGQLPGADWIARVRDLVSAQPTASVSPAGGHFRAGEALLKLLRVRDALREFNRGIEVDPAHADCHVGRGSALTQVGALEAGNSADEHPMLPWLEAALAAYEQAIAHEPTNGNGHLGRGVMLMNLGRESEGREAVRTAVRVDPANADVRSTWGAYLAQEGRLEDALEHFEAALRANPRHTQAYQNRAYALHQLGRDDSDEDLWIAAGYLEKAPWHEAKRAARGLGRRLKGLLSKRR